MSDPNARNTDANQPPRTTPQPDRDTGIEQFPGDGEEGQRADRPEREQAPGAPDRRNPDREDVEIREPMRETEDL
jgi:hypothetical protein